MTTIQKIREKFKEISNEDLLVEVHERLKENRIIVENYQMVVNDESNECFWIFLYPNESIEQQKIRQEQELIKHLIETGVEYEIIPKRREVRRRKVTMGYFKDGKFIEGKPANE